MDNRQVRKFFINKDTTPCPLTKELIGKGYVQKSGGYIKYAESCGVKKPTQYWHLISSWSDRSKENRTFGKTIKCGELIFWMAEVSQSVDTETLAELKNTLINDYLDDTKHKEGNLKIQEVCFDNIARVVEQFDKEH